MSSPSETFARRLKAARELRQLNQAELAERAGLQATAISHFETGTRRPSFDNLRRLADALEVTTDYLLGRSADPTVSSGAADALFRDYAKLTAHDRTIARDFMSTLAKRKAREK
jgi:transcriptional regulator with XRE-family HTH domain